MKMKKIEMQPSACLLGMSDGSERGCYVPQAHIFSALGRPHGWINLMFEYFPGAPDWPDNDREKLKDLRIFNGQYTNGYFHYMANEPGGNNHFSEPFPSIRDVRKYGQDVHLSMTFDLNTPDKDLIRIARDLRRFGKVILRINHECNGNWFSFNQFHTYKEVSDFFVRCHDIFHTHAPNVLTNLCLNGFVWNKELKTRFRDEDLGEAIKTADIISYDQYNSLHFGWPNLDYDPVREGFHGNYTCPEGNFYILDDELWFRGLQEFYDIICTARKEETDIYLAEFNNDAECIGLQENADWIKNIYTQFIDKSLSYLKGIIFYHYRDRGGLGLEYEYNEERSRYDITPAREAYREICHHPFYNTGFKRSGDAPFPFTWEWRASENSIGLEWMETIPEDICRIELVHLKKFHGIIKVNDCWFYHSGEVDTLDISRGLSGHDDTVTIRMFATPPDGENPADTPDVYKLTLSEKPVVVFKKTLSYSECHQK